MKKLFSLALATMFALAAGAQNRTIDAIAQNYSDRDGFTVVNMEGDAIRNLSRMVADGDGTITLDNGEKHNISELLEEIVSFTAIVMRGVNETFTADMRGALEAVDYSPVVSHNDGDMKIRVMSANIRRGHLRGNKEIVATIEGGSQTMLVRMIGKVDTDLLAGLATEMM